MFCCCRGMGHQERQHTVHDGLHYFCTWTQGQSNKPVTVCSTEDSRLSGVKATVSFYLLCDKERTLLPANFFLILLRLAIFWYGDKCRCSWHVNTKRQTNTEHPLTTPWLSFSDNSYNLCRVAKSCNHWLAISKHFCHLPLLPNTASLTAAVIK